MRNKLRCRLGKQQVEDKRARRRADIRLPGLRENDRQAAAVANGWLRGPVAAWNWLPTGEAVYSELLTGVCKAQHRFEQMR
jgi:hypothetical protein